jgi:hypothetical protein
MNYDHNLQLPPIHQILNSKLSPPKSKVNTFSNQCKKMILHGIIMLWTTNIELMQFMRGAMFNLQVVTLHNEVRWITCLMMYVVCDELKMKEGINNKSDGF